MRRVPLYAKDGSVKAWARRARVIVGGRERTTHHATEAEAARGVRELRALHMTHTNEQRS